MPATLAAHHELLPLAQQDHRPIRLRKQLDKLLKHLLKQRLKIESSPQVLSNLQDDLQFQRRVMSVDALVKDGGVDLLADDEARLGAGHGGAGRKAKRYGPIWNTSRSLTASAMRGASRLPLRYVPLLLLDLRESNRLRARRAGHDAGSPPAR